MYPKHPKFLQWNRSRPEWISLKETHFGLTWSMNVATLYKKSKHIEITFYVQMWTCCRLKQFVTYFVTLSLDLSLHFLFQILDIQNALPWCRVFNFSMLKEVIICKNLINVVFLQVKLTKGMKRILLHKGTVGCIK